MAKAKAKRESPDLTLVRGKLSLVKDPRIWARKLPMVPADHKRFLGLDFSSTTGATICDIIPGQPITAATLLASQWNLTLGPHDTNAIRYVRLRTFLQLTRPDLIFYEEVKYTGQTPGGPRNIGQIVARAISGAQLVHSLSAVMLTWAEMHDIPCQAISIGTLKKYATGSGNANKVDMIKAANEQFGTELDPDTYEATGADNIADSVFLCAMAVQNYAEGVT